MAAPLSVAVSVRHPTWHPILLCAVALGNGSAAVSPSFVYLRRDVVLLFCSCSLLQGIEGELVGTFANGIDFQNPLLSLQRIVHSNVVPPVGPVLRMLVAKNREYTFSHFALKLIRGLRAA